MHVAFCVCVLLLCRRVLRFIDAEARINNTLFFFVTEDYSTFPLSIQCSWAITDKVTTNTVHQALHKHVFSPPRGVPTLSSETFA